MSYNVDMNVIINCVVEVSHYTIWRASVSVFWHQCLLFASYSRVCFRRWEWEQTGVSFHSIKVPVCSNVCIMVFLASVARRFLYFNIFPNVHCPCITFVRTLPKPQGMVVISCHISFTFLILLHHIVHFLVFIVCRLKFYYTELWLLNHTGTSSVSWRIFREAECWQ